jgi:uncharacterized membrane protein YhaH (DUF805 family)
MPHRVANRSLWPPARSRPRFGATGRSPTWLWWLSIVAVVLGAASAITMLGPTDNGSLVYGVLLTAVVLFAWLVASGLVLVRRAVRPQ